MVSLQCSRAEALLACPRCRVNVEAKSNKVYMMAVKIQKIVYINLNLVDIIFKYNTT
jgi:hypothetical protein